MKYFLKTTKSLSTKFVLVLECTLFISTPLSYGVNCAPGQSQTCSHGHCSTTFCATSPGLCGPCQDVTVSVSGNSVVATGGSADFTCDLTAGVAGGSYAWTHSGFTGSSSSETISLTAGTVSTAVGDKSISCTYTAPEGCTGNSSTSVTIFEMEGDTSVSEGNSGSFNMVPEDLSVSSWSVTPQGATEILKSHELTPDGSSATVIFYWFPGGATYSIEANCGGVVVSKEVSVTLPAEGGQVSVSATPNISYTVVTVGDEDYVKVNSVTIYNVSGEVLPFSIPPNSPFFNKVTIHENKHLADFDGGSSSPAAAAGQSYLDSVCIPYYGVLIIPDTYFNLAADWAGNLMAYLETWAETRAYAESDPVWPTCAY